MTDSVTITAAIVAATAKRVCRFRNESGWSILNWKDDAGVTFVGKGTITAEPVDGARYKLSGKWEVSKFTGLKEFAFASATPDVPTDPRAMLNYAATISKGIGPAKANAIWEAYGADWMDHPDLALIKGLTAEARYRWSETIEKIRNADAETTATAFLLDHGCSARMAEKAFELWRDNTIQTVTADCYALTDLPMVGFSEVDSKIRRFFGIADDDIRRVQAAVLYYGSMLAAENGTAINKDALIAAVLDAIHTIATAEVHIAIGRLEASGKIRLLNTSALADASDYNNELTIHQYLSNG